MVGITSYGAYIPLYRLSRAEISQAWGGPPIPGEKAVANFDEDSITMAVAATIDCTKGIKVQTIDGLYSASTTSPYKEKQAAATIAKALELRRDVFTTDFANSLRCGTTALRAAMDAINGKSAKSVVVCAADTRMGLPNGTKELEFGDGAAALLLGSTGIIATIDHCYSINDEIIDMWRAEEDVFVRSWEDRFVREKGYNDVVIEAVSSTLQKYKLEAKDFAKAIFFSPNPGAVTGVAKKLGFDVKTQVQDTLYSTVGNTGAALSLMLLVAALEEAKPGDKLLLANYGDGCDVYILTVTEEIEKVRKVKGRHGIAKHLEAKQALTSYEKYLRWRKIVPTEPPARPPHGVPSAVALWRDSKGGLALCGSKCKVCSTPQYPKQRVCMECGTKDQMEDYRFADKEASLFTFSVDNLAASPAPPTVTSVVDFKGGGRVVCDMTDRDLSQVKVDMPLEMTFRLLRHVDGINDYWWKCQPIRCGK